MFYNTPLCELLEQRVVEIYSRNDAAQQNAQPVQSSRLPWEDRLWMSCGRDAASEAPPGMGSSHCERAAPGPRRARRVLERQRRGGGVSGMRFALVSGEPGRSPGCETGERRGRLGERCEAPLCATTLKQESITYAAHTWEDLGGSHSRAVSGRHPGGGDGDDLCARQRQGPVHGGHGTRWYNRGRRRRRAEGGRA